MERNGRPFFGVSGEFHFSRMNAERWEDELIKMKMCKINMVTTYVFWIHHEEEERSFLTFPAVRISADLLALQKTRPVCDSAGGPF